MTDAPMTDDPIPHDVGVYEIAAFYAFTPVADTDAVRLQLIEIADLHAIKGMIYVASEGVNATVSGAPGRLDGFLTAIRRDVLDGALVGVAVKRSRSTVRPFRKLRVRLKSEIVTFRTPEADPANGVGTYVAPENWNALISAPDVVTIDVRNHFEVALGTFAGARDPDTRSFTAFKTYVDTMLDVTPDTRIATFCTGGIRCEKATAYLRAKGYREVYHLEGGILRYLEEIPPSQSMWQGSCFVFDERVAVDHDLNPSGDELCRACGWPKIGRTADTNQAAADPGDNAQTTPRCGCEEKKDGTTRSA